LRFPQEFEDSGSQNVMHCCLVSIYQHFNGTQCLHLQGLHESQNTHFLEPSTNDGNMFP